MPVSKRDIIKQFKEAQEEIRASAQVCPNSAPDVDDESDINEHLDAINGCIVCLESAINHLKSGERLIRKATSGDN